MTAARAGADDAAMPPPVPRMDVRAALAAIRRDGVELELSGMAPGGEVGAAFVRWPDGREGVLTRAGDGSGEAGEALRLTAAVLERARTHGVPTPRYDLIVPMPGAHLVVQERLPGAPPGVVGPGLVAAMVEQVRTWEGLLDDLSELEAPSLHLSESGPGFCLHESLQRYDRRSRALLAQVHEVGRTVERLDGHDLVHLDYHLGNVLVGRDGGLTGIVDWDGWGRGDRWFSVEVLAFHLAWLDVDAGLRREVDDLVEAAVPPDRLRGYRASLSLRHVDWAIRHHGPAEVDRWLSIAAARLPAR